MLTEKEAKQAAIEKYKSLWGVEQFKLWLSANTLADTSPIDDPIVYDYSIDQDDSFNNPDEKSIFNPDGSITIDETTLPAHRSSFEVNRETGEVKVTEHW